ncbi:MAG TPA: hypothetical protein VFE44_03185 [Thermoanaerobaculia bacterium]|nr:hypothetical protein [Thermoanaerobaculia bacterium]
MVSERVRKQVELLRRADRDRQKTGIVLLALGISLLAAAFWIRIEIEVASFALLSSGSEWLVPILLKDLVSSFFAVRVLFIAGIAFSVWGIRELLDRSPRALLIALAEDLEERHKKP